MTSPELVLVTGGSGFVASHCIVALLREKYSVRTTLRSPKRRDEVLDMIKAGGATEEQANGVDFVVADLTKDDGWVEACKDCTYVLHVASPFPPAPPKNADDLIVPAREGTLRALKAAKEAVSVKRVVVTSSFAAIGYGHAQRDQPFTEEDWTVLENPDVAAYHRSKRIAERAAWDWHAKEGGSMELAVVNPVGVYGPVLGKDYATSIELVYRLINGQMPGLPRFQFGIVDVRDVADLHLKAMIDPKASGQRFIAISDDPFLSVLEIAQKLKAQLGDKAKKVPTRVAPDFIVRAIGYFDATVGMLVPELGKNKNASNKKAKDVLGWQPRSADEALKSAAESLYQFGLVK